MHQHRHTSHATTKCFRETKTHEMNKIDDMCCNVIAIFGITARILILSCLM